MAGRFIGKPYERPLTCATKVKPEIKEELKCLPRAVREAIDPFLRPEISLDTLHEMELICFEEMQRPNNKALLRAQERIRDYFREESNKFRVLYNPRNISLNQCIGESKTPVSEWLNVTGRQEWDDS